jgi:hypothetical protein
MSERSLFTKAGHFRRVLATNTTSNTAFAAKADLAAAPAVAEVDTAAGYITFDSGESDNYTPNTIQLVFFGAGNDNQTGKCRLHGLRPVRTATGLTNHTHTLLAEYTFTLSAAVGLSGGAVSASERYADTITRTLGIENVSDQIVSPTGDTPGHVLVDVKGCPVMLVELIRVDANSINALWAPV